MSIRLDKEKGVNPAVLRCEWCLKDYGVALLGTGGFKRVCNSCGVTNVGKRGQTHCGKCDSPDLGPESRMSESEPLVHGLCDECEEKRKRCEEMVRAGGIFFHCPNCGSQGALDPNTELAKAVRAQTGIEPPGPVGIEFDVEHCPICSEETKH